MRITRRIIDDAPQSASTELKSLLLHSNRAIDFENSLFGLLDPFNNPLIRLLFIVTDLSRLGFCTYPGQISNGRVSHLVSETEVRQVDDSPDERQIEYPERTRMQYTCSSGYNIQGPDILTCEISGIWSENPPKCVEG